MFVAFIVSTSFPNLSKSTFADANLFLSVIFFSVMVMFMVRERVRRCVQSQRGQHVRLH